MISTAKTVNKKSQLKQYSQEFDKFQALVTCSVTKKTFIEYSLDPALQGK